MLKNHWYVACESAELVASPVGKIVCEEPIVIFRRSDGTASILRNVCPHRQAPLSMGSVKGDSLRCIYHGIEFDGAGRCVHIPSQTVIPPKAHIRSFPAVERYGFVWIWPGNPELADESLLPSLPWRDDTTWDATLIQYFHVKASHQLMSDNLLDLSHVAFLHEKSIGFDPKRLEHDPLEITIEDKMVRTSRVFKNTFQAPAHKAWRELSGEIDRVQVAEWSPPSSVRILVRNENGEEQVDLRADHLITPETETTHHYYIAISRNFRVGDEQLTSQLDRDARQVHQEDVDIAEAQQSMRRWTRGAPDMALKADRAVNASHRILAAMSEAEATPTQLE